MSERKTKIIIYSNPAPESWLERSFLGADVQKDGMTIIDSTGRKQCVIENEEIHPVKEWKNKTEKEVLTDFFSFINER